MIDKASLIAGDGAFDEETFDGRSTMEKQLEEFAVYERSKDVEKFEYEMPELEYLPDPDYFDH